MLVYFIIPIDGARIYRNSRERLYERTSHWGQLTRAFKLRGPEVGDSVMFTKILAMTRRRLRRRLRF